MPSILSSVYDRMIVRLSCVDDKINEILSYMDDKAGGGRAVPPGILEELRWLLLCGADDAEANLVIAITTRQPYIDRHLVRKGAGKAITHETAITVDATFGTIIIVPTPL